MKSLQFALCIVLLLGQPARLLAGERLRTILGGEYWYGGEVTPDYLDYLAEVKPDVIHGGVLGPELASTVHGDKHRKAITYISPGSARTMKDYCKWWRGFLEQAHRHGIKVQATFSLTNVWGDHENNLGWFRYYRYLWEQDVLGARPAPGVAALMERNAAGEMIRYGKGWSRYAGCVNNPHWRRALKAMAKLGVDAGFDGFMVQYPHARGPCACEHCQRAFRAFLARRFAVDALAKDFGIKDIRTHRFPVTGPRPGKSEPIDLAARQFAAESVKACFDEVFIDYGRSLKPDLIVSQWTHFRRFLQANVLSVKAQANVSIAKLVDERLLLPLPRWGRGEDYLWYSTPVYKSDLEIGITGNAALTHKYLRAMAPNTPFEVLKYDYFRWRVTVGEALANGGMAFGAWKGGWSGGLDREEPHLKTYFRFIRDNDKYLGQRQSHAEVALVYPRRTLVAGDAAFLAPFRRAGQELIAAPMLFDVIIDERLSLPELHRRRAAVIFGFDHLTEIQQAMLTAYRAAGGLLLAPSGEGDKLAFAPLGAPPSAAPEGLAPTIRRLANGELSTFDAPWTVQVHADHQPQEHRFLLHLVNYNRDESQPKKELPIAAGPVGVDLILPVGVKARRIRFRTPEVKRSRKVAFTQSGRRLRFTTPGFLVYGFAAIDYR